MYYPATRLLTILALLQSYSVLSGKALAAFQKLAARIEQLMTNSEFEPQIQQCQ